MGFPELLHIWSMKSMKYLSNYDPKCVKNYWFVSRFINFVWKLKECVLFPVLYLLFMHPPAIQIPERIYFHKLGLKWWEILWILTWREKNLPWRSKQTETCLSVMSFRMGSVTYDGVARLRRHSWLEHVLPHAGHHHPQAEEVRVASHSKVLFRSWREASWRRPGLSLTLFIFFFSFLGWWRSSHE